MTFFGHDDSQDNGSDVASEASSNSDNGEVTENPEDYSENKNEDWILDEIHRQIDDQLQADIDRQLEEHLWKEMDEQLEKQIDEQIQKELNQQLHDLLSTPNDSLNDDFNKVEGCDDFKLQDASNKTPSIESVDSHQEASVSIINAQIQKIVNQYEGLNLER